MEEEDYSPKTIKDVIELWMSQNNEGVEADLIIGTPKNRMDWLYNNLKRRIIELCELKTNKILCEVCDSDDVHPERAARVITEAIWEYFHPN